MRRPRLIAGVCLSLLAAGAAVALAHGGPPLRIGVTADPALAAVGRLVLVHLREGVGFAVDWREFPDEAALEAAFARGTIDIAVASTGPGSAQPSGAGCPPELPANLGDRLRSRWLAEPFLLAFLLDAGACTRPALIVSRTVLEDLRFGILRKESDRVAALLTPEDVAAVRAAALRGGERAATAAARAALAAKAAR